MPFQSKKQVALLNLMAFTGCVEFHYRLIFWRLWRCAEPGGRVSWGIRLPFRFIWRTRPLPTSDLVKVSKYL